VHIKVSKCFLTPGWRKIANPFTVRFHITSTYNSSTYMQMSLPEKQNCVVVKQNYFLSIKDQVWDIYAYSCTLFFQNGFCHKLITKTMHINLNTHTNSLSHFYSQRIQYNPCSNASLPTGFLLINCSTEKASYNLKLWCIQYLC